MGHNNEIMDDPPLLLSFHPMIHHLFFVHSIIECYFVLALVCKDKQNTGMLVSIQLFIWQIAQMEK